MALPEFVRPMLATLESEPFDSPVHLFEIKWDGIRALSFVEDGRHRLLSRNRQDLLPRYPELAGLAALPGGTLLDGELVVFDQGRPSFSASLERVQARNPLRVQALARERPAVYAVFDLLYRDGRSIMERPLVERRAALRELLESARDPRLSFSDGVEGQGLAFFGEVRERGLEGMLAKERESTYQPGQRTRAWIKVKTTRSMPCLILGWLADERGELRSLVLGAEEAGQLVCVGRVGSGLSDAQRSRLRELCQARARATPLVASGEDAHWVEPGLYCKVTYLERTANGLRAPVFEELLEEG
jgi:DNA ligase D-like protein (predicted ligase)